MNTAVHPAEHSPDVGDGLALAGAHVSIIDELTVEALSEPDVDVLVVEVTDSAVRTLREVSRIEEILGLPVLAVVRAEHFTVVESMTTEFVVAPVDPVEFRIRLRRLVTEVDGESVLVFKDLELNPLNYQAALGGEAMDLTYMEYELLRFLVENPVRVWSREQLLSKVWGYEYYGGARTVDVHVRRLRAKLGEERSSWITTVRSVGYRFG